MYLLFEWTEEREGKNHVGIYSTVEKAKKAAELAYKESGDHDDLPEGDYHELEWDGLVGTKSSGYEQDFPYDIEEFEVDMYTSYKYGPGTDNPTMEVHEL